MRRRLVPPVIGVLATLLSALAAPSVASAAGHRTSIRDGATQDTYSYADAVRQSVWVDTGLTASGRPGGHVRVAADVIRPRELDGTTTVPVIMEASPYYRCCGRGNESQVKKYDPAGNPVTFPLFCDNHLSRAATPSCWSTWPAPTGHRAVSTPAVRRTSPRPRRWSGG